MWPVLRYFCICTYHTHKNRNVFDIKTHIKSSTFYRYSSIHLHINHLLISILLRRVIRRLVQLINDYAKVIADQKASLSQAQSATQALNNYLDSSSVNKLSKDGDKISKDGDELSKLRTELKTTEEDAKKSQSEYYAIKSQCDNLTKEYDRLSEENAKLQKKYDNLVSSSGTKKGD